MSFDVDVRVAIPREYFRHLATLAAANSTTVGALVRECVRRQVGGVPPIRETGRQLPATRDALMAGSRTTSGQKEAIRKLHAEGLADTTIAERLGMSNSTVGYHRKAMGLPNNYRGRRRLT